MLTCDCEGGSPCSCFTCQIIEVREAKMPSIAKYREHTSMDSAFPFICVIAGAIVMSVLLYCVVTGG